MNRYQRYVLTAGDGLRPRRRPRLLAAVGFGLEHRGQFALPRAPRFVGYHGIGVALPAAAQ